MCDSWRGLKTIFYIIAGMLLCLVACKREPKHEETYRYVRSIIDSVPDQALLILDSIPMSDLQSDLDSARYILLHATAENKLHANITPDTILKKIIPVFTKSNLKDEARYAYYLTGRYLSLQDSFDQAFGYLLKAEDLIDNETSSYEKGLIYHELADCTNNFLNGPSSIEYITLAETAYAKANLPTHYLYALSDHAMYLNNIGDYKAAERKLNQILDSIKVYKDDFLKSWCYDGLMRSKIGQDQFKDALLYYELLSENTDTIDDATMGLVLVAERKAGSLQRADSIAKYLLKKGNYWALNELNIDDMPKEFISKAYYYQSKYCDDMIRKAYGETFTVTLRDNLQLNKELNQELIKNKKLTQTIYLTSFLLMLLVTTGGVYLIYRKWRNQRDKNNILYNDFMNFINEYNNVIKNQTALSNRSSLAVSALLEKHAININTIVNTYYENKDLNAIKNRRIIRHIKSTIAALSNKTELISELENIINVKNNGILNDLKCDLPELTEEEFKIFMLSAAGFSNITIAHILGITSANHAAVMKTNLRKKIRNSLPNDVADKYITAIY